MQSRRKSFSRLRASRVALVLPLAVATLACDVRARPASPAHVASSIPALPVPTTNHAVAAGTIDGRWQVFVMLGLDATKRWSGITTRAWTWSEGQAAWRALPPVPGKVGRLAATAQVVRGRVYLFGGYTVDSAGGEKSVPALDILDPVRGTWSAGAPIPLPVDDAVSGVYRDSLIYLVSGWHDTDNVRDVQIYDVTTDRWTAGTPIPGVGVFGHTGAMAGDRIVYIDGARRNSPGPRYVNESQAWVGRVLPARPDSIVWTRLPTHPAPVRYRAAATSCGPFVVFAGGTDNPYNYNGVGYDGAKSEPIAQTLAYDTSQRIWRALPSAPVATMDHRGLVQRADTAWTIGGMTAGQVVTAQVVQWRLGLCPR